MNVVFSEKILNIVLSGVGAAVVTFTGILWNQTETLEREIASLRTNEIANLQDQIEEIKRIGEVEIFLHQECQELSAKMFEANAAVNSLLEGSIRQVFEERGCVLH